MLLELAKAISFLLCILSLYSVMLSGFFLPAANWQQLATAAFFKITLAAAVSFASGCLFLRHPSPAKNITARALFTTLPVRLFFAAIAIMALLFCLTWYLEEYYMPLQKLR